MIRLGSEVDVSLKAILSVKKQIVPKLTQSGHNRGGGNYKYYSQLDFIEIDKELLKFDCLFICSTDKDTVNIEGEWHEVNGKDRYVTAASCILTARVQSAENPEDFVEIESYGYKVDLTSDKALGAATIAKRYAYMHMFNIATIEADPDADENDFRQQYDSSSKPKAKDLKSLF